MKIRYLHCWEGGKLSNCLHTNFPTEFGDSKKKIWCNICCLVIRSISLLPMGENEASLDYYHVAVMWGTARWHLPLPLQPIFQPWVGCKEYIFTVGKRLPQILVGVPVVISPIVLTRLWFQLLLEWWWEAEQDPLESRWRRIIWIFIKLL